MLRNFLNLIESVIQAVTYLLILVIGLTAAGLGAFLVVLLALRFGQLIWAIILKEPWI
jgi:hypothetical protein